MSVVWVYVIIAVAGVALVAAIVIAAMLLWQRQVRLALIGLTGRREAVGAAYRALETVFAALADSDVEQLTAFATDPTSEHRKSLEELHTRMRMQAEELADLPLPKAQWKAADLLGVAAGRLAAEVGRVGEASDPEAVLEADGSIDVTGVTEALDPANAEIDRLLEEQGIEDPAVYGGGLYI
jgi:hypothetical protein